MTKLSDHHVVILVYAALAVITFVAFEQVLQNSFVNYDDTRYITENPHVKKGITGESIIWAFTESHFFMWHPLTSLSHMLDCQLFGLNPGWHHLISLLFHIASVLLLFGILKEMTGRVWPSVFVAAAFALHPLNVESVAWAAERKNVLSGFFWMLTIASYIRYTRRPAITKYLLVVLVFSFALMSKPTTVTLPFVLLLLDYWPLDRLQWRWRSKKAPLPQSQFLKDFHREFSLWRLTIEKIPLLVLSGVLCVITIITQKGGGSLKGTEVLPLGIRLANALVSYISYVAKLIYPCCLAPFYPHPGFNLSAWKPIVSLVILIAASAVIFFLGRRRAYLIVGWLWYLGTLVPVIGVIQSGGQAMADRYAYLPAIGIFIMVSWGIAELFTRWRYRKIVVGVSAVLLLVVMLICTRKQVSYWKSSFTLAGHALEVTENNSTMHNNYGCALYEAGQLDDAIGHFNEALRANPRYNVARRNLGKAFLVQGKSHEAIAALTEVLNAGEKQPDVYNGLGMAFAQLGKFDLAIGNYNKAMPLQPDDPYLHYHIGLALIGLQRYDEAISCFNNALRLDPQHIQSRVGIGKALLAEGNFNQAAEYFEQVLRIRQDMPEVYTNLGVAYAQLGKTDLAVKRLSRAIELKPDNVDSLNNLAWILATTKNDNLRNPGEAVKFALRACELTKFSQPEVLDTLAAAYAAAGNFPDAVTTAEEAISLALSLNQKELAVKIQKHLELYKSKTLYRE